jgi:hypothetical protein
MCIVLKIYITQADLTVKDTADFEETFAVRIETNETSTLKMTLRKNIPKLDDSTTFRQEVESSQKIKLIEGFK